MIIQSKIKYRIGILTGGGDVPGLDIAIRSFVSSALQAGYQVVGIKRGWKGLLEIDREKSNNDNSNNFIELNQQNIFDKSWYAKTVLHCSRTNPQFLPKSDVPEMLKDVYNQPFNDLTEEVLLNIEFLKLDYIVPFGGDDTLKYANLLSKKGIKVIGIPKTMDGDVLGTDYCIGFSTCVTRTVSMISTLKTAAASHERFMVIEVFGKNSGFTAMLPTLAGFSNRCVIPEYTFDMDQLTELLVNDRAKNPFNYSVVLVSEGAKFNGLELLNYDRKICSIGDIVAKELKENSSKFNDGKTIDAFCQNLGYLVRSGDPDAIDSVCAMGFSQMALKMINLKQEGKLISIRQGVYKTTDLDIVSSGIKQVDVERFYNTEQLRPKKFEFDDLPIFAATCSVFNQK